MPFPSFQDIIEQFEHVDDPDVLEKAKTNSALRHALEISRPENWRGSGLSPDQILPIAVEDGIPVAWVPPTDVLRALVEAPAEKRLEVLLAHEASVVGACRQRVVESDDDWLQDENYLVSRALDAFEAEHHEAALALAVTVGEPLAIWASSPRVHAFEDQAAMDRWEKTKSKKYKLAERELAAVAPGARLTRHEVLRHALIGPVKTFFTEFRPGDPILQKLSRHVVVHAPTPEHFSRSNALVGLMLVASILRDEQAWCEEVRMNDSVADEY